MHGRCRRVWRRHAVHVTRERVRDRRRHRAGGRAGLRARRAAADRAAGGEAAPAGVPAQLAVAQRPCPCAPQRRAGDPGDPRGLDRAGQRLPADDGDQRRRARPRRRTSPRAPRRSRARAGSSSRSTARIASTPGPSSAPATRWRSRTSSTPRPATRSGSCWATAPTCASRSTASSTAPAATARSCCHRRCCASTPRPDPANDPPQIDVWITLAAVGVIVAYAALSLINALVAALTGRRRELALLLPGGRDQARRSAGCSRPRRW